MLHYREYTRGVTLIVSGDGDLRSYSFRDFSSLMKFQSEMEEFLVKTGWSPSELTIDPRLTAHHVTTPVLLSAKVRFPS